MKKFYVVDTVMSCGVQQFIYGELAPNHTVRGLVEPLLRVLNLQKQSSYECIRIFALRF